MERDLHLSLGNFWVNLVVLDNVLEDRLRAGSSSLFQRGDGSSDHRLIGRMIGLDFLRFGFCVG